MSQSGMVSIQGDFQMSPDMVQEVKVLTSAYAPEYGSSSSGQITMVSKSGGTNITEQHLSMPGTRYSMRRPGIQVAAARVATVARPTTSMTLARTSVARSRYRSFTTGPPSIIRSSILTGKHFTQAGGSNVPTLSIPSVLERGGNFTDWKNSSGNLIPIYMPGNASAACQTAAGVGPGQQFPGNIIPAGCISPIAQAYLAVMPQPTNTQPFNNYTLAKPVPDSLVSNSNVFMTRIDHNYGDKDHFYFFWWRQFTGYNTATALPAIISTESPTRPQNSPIARFQLGAHLFDNHEPTT